MKNTTLFVGTIVITFWWYLVACFCGATFYLDEMSMELRGVISTMYVFTMFIVAVAYSDSNSKKP